MYDPLYSGCIESKINEPFLILQASVSSGEKSSCQREYLEKVN